MLTKLRRLLQKNDAGFTMIELLMVIVVIGVLAGIGVPVYQNAQNKAKEAKVEATASNLVTALEMYYIDNDSYPTTITQLNNLLDKYMTRVETGLVNFGDPDTATGDRTFKVYYEWVDPDYRVYTTDNAGAATLYAGEPES